MTTAKKKKARTPPLLTVQEAAEVMGVSAATINRWATQVDDPLPSRFINRLRRVVFPGDLVSWCTRHNVQPLIDPSDVAQPWPRP